MLLAFKNVKNFIAKIYTLLQLRFEFGISLSERLQFDHRSM